MQKQNNVKNIIEQATRTIQGNAKKIIAMAGLSALALGGGAKDAKANTPTPTPTNEGVRQEQSIVNTEKTTPASQDKDVRYEQLQAVVRFALQHDKQDDFDVVKQQALKYMDFPAFLPVTQDGHFDKATSQKWIEACDFKKNFKHLQQYKQDLEQGVSVEEAYGTMAKNIADGDKAKEETMLQMLPAMQKALEQVNLSNVSGLGRDRTYVLLTLSLLPLGCGMLYSGAKGLKDFVDGNLIMAGGRLGLAGLISLTALGATVALEPIISPEQAQEYVSRFHQAMYNTCVEQQFEQAKKDILVKDANEAAGQVISHKNNGLGTTITETKKGKTIVEHTGNNGTERIVLSPVPRNPNVSDR
ncbi:MAG: hypothetical protein ILP11_00460 [Alphaproteobacteria bacterium]|nr:hypothetical protein [Alphaproteobacteria bacterium]